MASLLIAGLTARNQRALADLQAQRVQRKAELADRRTDGATFLQAYEDVFAGGENLLGRAKVGEADLEPCTELFDEIRRFKQAHLVLSITMDLQARVARLGPLPPRHLRTTRRSSDR